MLPKVVGPTTCCLLLSSGVLAAPRKDDPPPVYYHPTVAGDKAVFELDDGDRQWEAVHEVTEARRRGAATLVTLRTDGGTASWRLEVSDKGVYEVRDEDGGTGRSFWRLRLPAKKGETWETSHVQDGKPYVIKYTHAGEEEAEVPAGRFRCVRVESECVFNGLTCTSTSWVAPRYGLVKHQMVAKDGVNMDYVRSMVLKSFAPGGK